MKQKLRIVLAQLNFLVGDLQGNLAKHIAAAKSARDVLDADMIVFPELSLTGYPPEDLLFREGFLKAAHGALLEFKSQVTDMYCVIGHPQQSSAGLLNTCSLIYNDDIVGCYAKQFLPNYGVFDEKRYFIPGHSACVIPINGIPVGLIICEDLWHPTPVEQAKMAGAQIILALNASPFEIDKQEQRLLTLTKRVNSVHLPIMYVNGIGGQDDLVFDGGSMVVDQHGQIAAHAGFFKESLLPVDIYFENDEVTIPTKSTFELPGSIERIYQALVLGVRDYVQKNHFKGALIGVSGGIDSALTLAIAVDALGKDNVAGIMMPSRYTSAMSMEDSQQLIDNLQVKYEIISIEPAFSAFLESLTPLLSKEPGITEENIQARCRGVLMMALSNQTGRIVLTTGNRSEMAVGYATLYGDMAGGLAVLKDVPKTMVYELAHYRNQLNPLIPQRIIDRPPTAELAFDQKDEDTLPSYAILDKILYLYLNQEKNIDEIIALGFSSEIVTLVVKLIHKSEYKRRQAPVGIRINHQAFGRDRRYPITSGE